MVLPVREDQPAEFLVEKTEKVRVGAEEFVVAKVRTAASLVQDVQAVELFLIAVEQIELVQVLAVVAEKAFLVAMVVLARVAKPRGVVFSVVAASMAESFAPAACSHQ